MRMRFLSVEEKVMVRWIQFGSINQTKRRLDWFWFGFLKSNLRNIRVSLESAWLAREIDHVSYPDC